VLVSILNKGGCDGADLVRKANAPDAKAKLRALTAEAKALGICGVPTYRVFHQTSMGDWANTGGVVWGQDETNVIEDLVAGWDVDSSETRAEVRRAHGSVAKWRL
jgi:2-hydroxychromene-2-carboxylate isomerase